MRGSGCCNGACDALEPATSLVRVVATAVSAFPQRVITTIAGTDWLFPDDGQPAALNAPLSGAFGRDLAVDRNGNYFIADDENLMVMRAGPDVIINVIAGNGFGFFLAMARRQLPRPSPFLTI